MKEYNPNYLDFEQPLLEIEAKIKQLKNDPERTAKSEAAVNKLEKDYIDQTKKIFGSLSDWQISQLARHPLRPYTLDYIPSLFTSFEELHGDRIFGDDPAIISGIAKIDDFDFMFIGHQKGRDAKEKVKRNFGMPKPEGYRKALRLMEMAERFKMPIMTFIDTPGAYPGVGAEERGQSEAIARNLKVMAALKVPTICTVIGEGGSGGELAIGVGDRVNMLQYSTYSVISPEGCASILWKSADKAPLAAEAMGVTAERVKELDLINNLVEEPLGGAHRNYDAMARNLKVRLKRDLADLQALSLEEMLDQRYKRLMSFGYC